MDNVNTEKLMRDMRAVVLDTEDLLKATATQTGERMDKVRAKAEESLRVARERLQGTGYKVEARVREAAGEVDDTVHNNPWATAGVAAGIGLLLGVLIGRR